MRSPVAVLASSCEFAQARTPQQLWQLALHGRQCFRRLPPQRLPMARYLRGDDDPDGLYPIEAALIEGYAFDRERFLVPLSAFEGTDLTHWLALDLADRALAELPVGWTDDQALKDRCAVVVANTLTGEFSRANLLRYRWPFVEQRLRRAASGHLPAAEVGALIADFERQFKQPFPAPDADSLAGGLANTIAGRIANHFGLRGGAYSVDGACASSLVAVISACDRLAGGDVDLVVVAVDLSLDPFELVGFARNQALARDEMRVFDARSNGFWPGEGGGCVLLSSAAVARQRGWSPRGWICGTGIATDGQGGLTRPTADGQLLAQRRAWSAAGLDPASADYVEAHGTGTPTGDPVELEALSRLLGPCTAGRSPVAVASVKANIGQTKANAGMAGLLQALAVAQARVLPAASGCPRPHAVLAQPSVGAALRLLQRPEAVGHDRPLRVGVNGFGFGGVNCHVVVQGPDIPPQPALRVLPLPAFIEGRLPGELFRLQADSRQALASAVTALRSSINSGEQHSRASTWSWSAPRAQPVGLSLLFGGQGLALDMAAAHEQHTAALQPVLAEQALAALAVLTQSGLQPDRVLGHSFGELPACRAAGLIDDQGLRQLARLRGQAMQDAAPAAAMLALACTLSQAEALAQQFGLDVACHNTAQGQVLAGGHEAIDTLARACAAKGIASNRLPASRAFHSQLMRAAAARFKAELAVVEDGWKPAVRGPAPLLLSTITGAPLATGLPVSALQALLVEQFCAPVRFAEAAGHLPADDLVIEAGAGLGALLARADADVCLAMSVFGDSLAPMLAVLGAAWVGGHEPALAWLQQGRWIQPLRWTDRPSLLASPCGEDEDEVADRGESAAPRPSPTPDFAAQPFAAGGPMHGKQPALALLQASISSLAGLPRERVLAQSRLLADLHLNLIRARHVVTGVARQMGIQRLPFSSGQLADSTLGEMAAQLDQLRAQQCQNGAATPPPPAAAAAGVRDWVRLFTMQWLPAAAGPQPRGEAAGDTLPPAAAWRLDDRLAPLDEPVRLAMQSRFADDPGLPLLLTLPDALAPQLRPETVAAVLAALLCAAKAAVADGSGLLVLQPALLADGFLRSLAQEHPRLRLCAFTHEAPLTSDALERAMAHYAGQHRGFSAARVDGGALRVPSLMRHRLSSAPTTWLPGPKDLVLVSGGAKGIGAVSALALRQAFGCRLALVGRSAPDDPEVTATLAKADGGADVHYLQLDLNDATATRQAMAALERIHGPVRALVHAAGINRPALLTQLDAAELTTTLAAKLNTLDSLLAALRPGGSLRLLVGYGSIIGELGLRGESHYALANGWLAVRLQQLGRSHAGLRCLCIAWTAWRDAGMARRIDGVLDELARQDTVALSNTQACEQLLDLLRSDHDGQTLVVAGRHGHETDPRTEAPLLQRQRFLAWPQVYYPGIELVAQCELSTESDPYLLDPAPQGLPVLPVLPLVAMIEAAVSAARLLCADSCMGDCGRFLIEDLRIAAAISCAPGQSVVLRTAAMRHDSGTVDVVLRCSSTGFAVDHLAARLMLCAESVTTEADDCAGDFELMAIEDADAGVGMDAATLLYGEGTALSFHGPRFQRVQTYLQLRAGGCIARLTTAAAPRWYPPLQPPGFAAGHPAVRDAVLHALQACVPQHPVLPVSVQRIALGDLRCDVAYRVHARQTASDGHSFRFDIDLRAPDGSVVERWVGLPVTRSESAPAQADRSGPVSPALLQPWVGRLLADGLGIAGAAVAVSVGGGGRASGSQRAVRNALGRQARLQHQPDGAPWVAGHRVSLSHAGDLTLLVAHPDRHLACDLQPLDELGEADWPALLGRTRWDFAQVLLATVDLAAGLTVRQAGALVWGLTECLSKLGRSDWPADLQVAKVDVTARGGAGLVLRAAGLQAAAGLVRIVCFSAPAAVVVAESMVSSRPTPTPATTPSKAAAATVGS